MKRFLTTRLHLRHSQRRGSVLLVVIGLLGLMLLLGMAFYTFTAQEVDSASNYSEAAKVYIPNTDYYFNFGLEQLILGAREEPAEDENYPHSALRAARIPPQFDAGGALTQPEMPGRHSLVGGIFGTDFTPYNGAGIRLQTDKTNAASSLPFVDQNLDGTADTDQSALQRLNFSAAANNGTLPTVPSYPGVDTGYTAPDINSPYLAYKGTIPGTNLGGLEWSVIKPSFAFPQYMRGGPNELSNGGMGPVVFRPHPDHRTVNGIARFPVAGSLPAGMNNSFFAQYPTSGMSQGVWDLTTNPAMGYTPLYAWDVDNDGDGVKEGIWMDLDFPVQQSIDGTYFTAMFSFTVIDADGLVNLNTAGNIAGKDPTDGSWDRLNQANGAYLSRSNVGASRSEVNPQWALAADPALDPAGDSTFFTNTTVGNRDSALQQIRLSWTAPPAVNPTNSFNRVATSNLEWMQILMGRAEFAPSASGTYAVPGLSVGGPFTPSAYHVGRWGEQNALTGFIAPKMGTFVNYFATTPAPGVWGYDDDRLLGLGRTFFNPRLGFNRSFRHPMDIYGVGGTYLNSGNGLRIALRGEFAGTQNPMQWISVNPNQNINEDVDGDGNADINEDANFNLQRDAGENDVDGDGRLDLFTENIDGVAGLTNHSLNDELNAGAGAFYQWADDPDDALVESRLKSSSNAMRNDEMFGADENAGLHLSNSDWASARPPSRLKNLAPLNFRDGQPSASNYLRGQFTTLSYDRIQPGMGAALNRFYDNNGNGVFDNGDELKEANVDSDRRDTDGDGIPDTYNNDGLLEFPPAMSANASSPAEPFRQELRDILRTEYGDLGLNYPSGYRLHMNQLATGIDWATGLPTFRDLTAHPTASAIDGMSAVNIGTMPQPPFTPGAWPTAAAQEWWARHDRQVMARDIYVLLYVLGGGEDGKTYLSTDYSDSNAGRNLYTDERLAEMAQFAVNYVDALDGDDVITVFEYDQDLGDGWNCDDNPYTTGDMVGGTAPDRLVVYGVERQSLTFSETLVIHTPQLPSDNDLTTYDDQEERRFTFLELRNVSPFGVSMDGQNWRIRIDGAGNPLRDRRLLLDDPETVAAGGQYTIGARTGNDTDGNGTQRPSSFRVNYDADEQMGEPTFETLIPRYTLGGISTGPLQAATNEAGVADPGIASPLTNLDLNLAGHANDYAMYPDLNGTTTANGNTFVTDYSPGDTIRFVLERRAQPGRHVDADKDDNPWVIVDRMQATVEQFGITDGMTATDLRNNALTTSSLQSRERTNPFSRTGLHGVESPPSNGTNDQISTSGWTGYVQNSFNRPRNYSKTSDITQWQAHFDRAFASPLELFSVPLFAPSDVTRRVGTGVNWNQAPTPTSDPADLQAYYAQERFLRPEYPASADISTPFNRWYRILELLTVPSRTHASITQVPYALHTPGKINLNTIRHRGVLAGLIDDAPLDASGALVGHLNPYYAASGLHGTEMLSDRYEGGRDWWNEFIKSRDQQDPRTGLYLPGMAHARPFQPLSFADGPIASALAPEEGALEHTILRQMPLDVDGSGSQPLNRRGLFEARDTTDRNTNSVDLHTRHRLLRKIANNSTTRSNVFIVYVSVGFFEAVKHTNGDVQIGGMLPGSSIQRGFFVIDRSLPESAYNPQTGRFDYRQFVKYRKTIQ